MKSSVPAPKCKGKPGSVVRSSCFQPSKCSEAFYIITATAGVCAAGSALCFACLIPSTKLFIRSLSVCELHQCFLLRPSSHESHVEPCSDPFLRFTAPSAFCGCPGCSRGRTAAWTGTGPSSGCPSPALLWLQFCCPSLASSPASSFLSCTILKMRPTHTAK